MTQLLLHNNSVTTCIVIIYRPPPSSANGFTIDLFFNEFSSLLEQLEFSSGKLLITGDFNIHVNDASDTTALKFLDLLDSFNLIQHINMPTHRNSNTLDLIIARLDKQIFCNLSVNDPLISDHFVLHCNLNLAKPTTAVKTVTCRKIRSVDIEKLRNDIINSSLCLSPQPALSELCDQYDEVLSSILDDHAPLLTKTFIQRPAAPWYNEDIAAQK